MSNYINEIIVSTNFMNNEILLTIEANMIKQFAIKKVLP